MSTTPPAPPPPPAPTWTTPPTEPGGITPAPRKSSWPTVLGIIAIAYASIGLLGGVCGVAFASLFAGGKFGPGAPMYPDWHVYWTIGMAVVHGVFEVLLLVAGIKLMSRQAGSSRFCRRWAIGFLPLCLITVPINFAIERAAGWNAQTGGPAGGPPEAVMLVMFILVVVFTLLWSCALPVFMLIWFARPKVKAEVAEWAVGEVAGGVGQGGAQG